MPELPAPVGNPGLPEPEPCAAVKPLTLQDVRASDFGFGDNGVTVQPDGLHSRNFTDRTVLKQTLLAGKPKITRKDACDKMRSERGQGRKALPKEKWVAVMRAAASQFPDLLRLDGEILCLKMIPDTSAGKVAYHNDLMRACRLSLRELIAAMDKAAEKKEERRAKRARVDD